MRLEITSAPRLEELLGEFQVAAVFFSGPNCGICKAVEPRLVELFENRYPRLGYLHVDIEKVPAAATAHHVFTIPTLLLFVEMRESERFVRAFGIGEVDEFLSRPYGMLYPE